MTRRRASARHFAPICIALRRAWQRLCCRHAARLPIRRQKVTQLLVVAFFAIWCSAISVPKGLLLAVVQPSDSRPRVVVVGGGFAGLAALRRLSRDFDCTLVDAKQFFEYVPGMCQPYVKPQYHQRLTFDYEPICEKMGVQWIGGVAWQLQGENKQLLVRVHNKADAQGVMGKSGATTAAAASEVALPFEYCIIAAGSQYGIQLDFPDQAVASNSSLWYPTLSSASNAVGGDPQEWRLTDRQRRIGDEYEAIRSLAKRGAHVVVIGAGFVGVEFATELRHYYPELDITILDSRQECCPSLCKGARRYIQRRLQQRRITTIYGVNYAEIGKPEAAQSFWSQLGKPLPQRTFTAVGMQPHCDFMPDASLDDRGWLRINDCLQVLGGHGSNATLLAKGHIFAIGNCAGPVPGLGPLPKNSYPAEEMAAHAARSIRRLERNRPAGRFYWRWPMGMSSTSLGPRDGVLVMNNRKPGSGFVAVRGILAVWIKELIRWTKVAECKMNPLSALLWRIVH